MTVRHSLLAAGAVLVLGMAVYLFLEVSRTPQPAQAERSAPSPSPTRVAANDIKPPPVRTGTLEPSPPPPPPVVRDTPRPPPRPTEVIERVPPSGPDPKIDAVMNEANRAYDQGDFEEAKQIAHRVLAQTPDNVRMLRIVVSSECIAGDGAEAQKYFAQLPADDRAQMRTRCERYGVTLKDP